ncbi:uncharacterized protein LOC100903477 [Galendromus occidentalis]|uniref:Uncharacterized protein LOC100903477 n=1 Tax=Galendromus occidentalis TaxID=34638 RepID=A0AAJ6QXG5_9ACAR|nr:uncharacterized protein LOC100903477 [Galendromus occidentalis]
MVRFMLLLLGVQGLSALSGRSDCDWKVLDEAASNFVFAGANSTMPVTSEELDEVCKIAENAIALCESFAKDCTSGLEAAMITIFLDAAKKDRQERCEWNREEYLDVATCLQEEASEGLRFCNARQAGYLQAVLRKEKKIRVPLACCYQKQYELCINRASSICGRKYMRYTKKVISIMSDELKDTACRKYTKNPDLCDELPAVRPVRQPMFSTIIPALVKIVGLN